MARKPKPPKKRAAPKPAEKRVVPRGGTDAEERVIRGPPVVRAGALTDVDAATAFAVGRAARRGGEFEPVLPRASVVCRAHGCGFVRASELLRHLRTAHGVPVRRGSCADCSELLFPRELLERLPPTAVLRAFLQHSRTHPLGGDFSGVEPVTGLH